MNYKNYLINFIQLLIGIFLIIIGTNNISLAIANNMAEDDILNQTDVAELLPPDILVSTSNAGFATDINNKKFYYNDKATVIIEQKENKKSKIYGVKIEVIGANEIEEVRCMGIMSKEIEITKEGESTIRAWTIDKEGNISKERAEITIYIDNTKPENECLNLEITKGESPLQNNWYNSEEVEVTIRNDTEKHKMEEYKVKYGTRQKGNKNIPNNLKELVEEQEKITIVEEGITEIIAYVESYSGVKSDIKVLDIQIDRTPPTMGELVCSKTDDNKIKITANEVSDSKEGSGMNEYLFFSDNEEGGKRILRSPSPQFTLSDMKSRSLISVVALDKAGNYATSSVPFGETSYPGLYEYSIYEGNGNRYGRRWHEYIIVKQEINAYLALRNSANLVMQPGFCCWYCQNVCACDSGNFKYTELRLCNTGRPMCDLIPGTLFYLPESNILNQIDPTMEPSAFLQQCRYDVNSTNENVDEIIFCDWTRRCILMSVWVCIDVLN